MGVIRMTRTLAVGSPEWYRKGKLTGEWRGGAGREGGKVLGPKRWL